MKRALPRASLLAGAVGACLLAGCGSSTKTVTVATPAGSQTGQTTKSSTAPATTAPAHTTSSPTASTTTAAPKARTAPEPAFAQKEAGGEGASAAAALVRAKGYTPNNTSDYRSNQTLRVLVGTRTGSGDGYAQQAFFFVNGRYIGTDASAPSASVRVVSQSDTEVTLAYALYRSSDPLCCPGGGQAKVRFQLNNGRLTPLDPIPPASSKSGLSRN